MNVNGVTQPVVYIPVQAIAPSVPNDHPISLPTPDRHADPTPGGTPFVGPTTAEKAGGHGHPGQTEGSAMLEPPMDRPSVVTPPVTPAEHAPAAPVARSRGAFDAYA